MKNPWQKVEEERQVIEIKQTNLFKQGRLPSASEIVITILNEMVSQEEVIHIYRKESGLDITDSFEK